MGWNNAVLSKLCWPQYLEQVIYPYLFIRFFSFVRDNNICILQPHRREGMISSWIGQLCDSYEPGTHCEGHFFSITVLGTVCSALTLFYCAPSESQPLNAKDP